MAKKKTEREILIETLNNDLQNAKEDYEIALNAFNYAEAEYIDIANAFLTAAKTKFDAVYRRNKKILQLEIENV